MDQGADQEVEVDLLEVLVVGSHEDQMRDCLFRSVFTVMGSWIEILTVLRSVRQTGDLFSPLTTVCQQSLSMPLDRHGGQTISSSHFCRSTALLHAVICVSGDQ